jgi:hypothetical protein
LWLMLIAQEIQVDGTEVVPIFLGLIKPLLHLSTFFVFCILLFFLLTLPLAADALDGTVRDDYVARVEPSDQGGRKVARLILEKMGIV